MMLQEARGCEVQVRSYAPSVPCRPLLSVTHDLTATLERFDGISFLLVILEA